MKRYHQETKKQWDAGLLWMLLAVTCWQGCHKAEYMPEAIGEEVPYADSTYGTVSETLKASTLTLFSRIWERSKLGDSINKAATDSYTILAADDEALTAAGWTEESIEAANPEVLDSLLSCHLLKGRAGLPLLADKTSAWIGESLSIIPGLYNRADGSPYALKASLRFNGEKLSVNGTEMGASAPLQSAQACIWPVNSLVKYTAKSAWDYLKSDRRFSLFMGILQYNDSVYNDLFLRANGYAAQTGGYRAQWYYRDSPKQLGMTIFEEAGKQYTYPLNTWFVPTDEAFRKAGFQTLDDLIAYNERRWMPDTVFSAADNQGAAYQVAFYAIKGCLPTDSLLDYHVSWGMRLAGFLHWESRNEIIWFQNDLNGQLPADLPVAVFSQPLYGQSSGYPPQPEQISSRTFIQNNPLVFPVAGEAAIANGLGQAIDIKGPDVYTLNGVVHAVDDLFFH